ncbi:MAG: hypothetical protein ACTILG_04160 [Sphingobacterium sp.]
MLLYTVYRRARDPPDDRVVLAFALELDELRLTPEGELLRWLAF